MVDKGARLVVGRAPNPLILNDLRRWDPEGVLSL